VLFHVDSSLEPARPAETDDRFRRSYTIISFFLSSGKRMGRVGYKLYVLVPVTP
jgi:hypothetical protein